MHISCLRIVLPLWAQLCILNLSIDAKVIEHMEHPCRICCLFAILIPSAPSIWREQFRQFQNSDSDSFVWDSVDSPCRNCQWVPKMLCNVKKAFVFFSIFLKLFCYSLFFRNGLSTIQKKIMKYFNARHKGKLM